ncbi:FAD-binding domain-containing protein [Apiospora kogelbergensis]|uniref:FAD-binding domain-containing protein n=1 Tax=Apiospora kogelbergensis TaxID=1337665 RepID=UPI00313218AB
MFFSKTLQPTSIESPSPPPSWSEAVRTSLTAELGSEGGSRAVGDVLYFPGSPEFADSETGFHTAQANEVRSAAVARPTSTAEVSALIKALRRSLPAPTPIAVRGGGHATFAGAAKAAGGVTIDMRGVRGIEVLGGGTRVRIAAGHRWSDVYTALEAHDPPLTTTGGRAGQVGVVGFLLGGGLSFFSHQHGFGADLVTAWEVVLASGQVVRATAPSSSGKEPTSSDADAEDDAEDLWDALRGGSTNFGIVTAVEMECFPHPKHFRCAYMFYLTPARQATLEAMVKMSRRPFDATPKDGKIEPVVDHLIWSITHIPYVPFKVIAVSASSTGPAGQDTLAEFAAPWTRIPGTSVPREVMHSAYAKEVGDLACKDGSRNSYKSVSVKLDLDLLNTIIDMWYDLVRATRHKAGFLITLAFLPVPSCVIEASCARRSSIIARDNSTGATTSNFFGLRPEDGPLVIVETCHNWHNAADDPFAFEMVGAFLRDVDRVASQRGLGSRWVFPNYAQPDEKVIQAYGVERLAQLKRVAARWDSDGFFQKRVVGGFKITDP